MPEANNSLKEMLHEVRRIEQSRAVLTEKKIRGIYKQLLKELRSFLGEEYIKYADGDGRLTVAMLQEKMQYARFLEEFEGHVNQYAPEASSVIQKVVEQSYTKAYAGMAEAVRSTAPSELEEALKGFTVRPETLKRAVENPVSGLTLPDTLEKDRKEVIYNIKQQLNLGLINGDRYETVAKKMADTLNFSYSKATNIVRTETHRVIEGGMMDCAIEMLPEIEAVGLIYAAIWRTMLDEAVRPGRGLKKGRGKSVKRRGIANHVQMEGKTVKTGELFDLGNGVKAVAPGQSGSAANDCRCRCFLEYELMTPEEFAKAVGEKSMVSTAGQLKRKADGGTINSGGISGALNPNSKEADEHAKQYYESIRHMKEDVDNIANNIGWKREAIEQIKNYIFRDEHDMIEGRKRFDPSYDMAQSWQRLMEGKYIKEQDLVLLKHEYLELKLVGRNMTQDEAHIEASKKHNFAKYLE